MFWLGCQYNCKLRFASDHDMTHSVLMGMLNPDHLLMSVKDSEQNWDGKEIIYGEKEIVYW